MARIALVGGLAAAFAVLAVAVAVGAEVASDAWLLQQASSVDALEAPARVVSSATGYAAVAVLTALVVAAQVRLGRVRDGVVTALSVGGAVIGNVLLKRLVDRPRPETADPAASDLSFPSGHAAATAALVLAVLLAVRTSRWLLAAGTLLLVAAAAAQLVLGLHHPSDVVGGWLWAATWTLAVRDAATSRRRPAARTRSAP